MFFTLKLPNIIVYMTEGPISNRLYSFGFSLSGTMECREETYPGFPEAQGFCLNADLISHVPNKWHITTREPFNFLMWTVITIALYKGTKRPRPIKEAWQLIVAGSVAIKARNCASQDCKPMPWNKCIMIINNTCTLHKAVQYALVMAIAGPFPG